MDWNNVIKALLCLGIMGGIFGFVLALASKIFAVHVDERIEPITQCLPGANCGGCGFAGCNAYATAIAAGKAPLNKCAAGGAEAAAKIAAIMGVEAGDVERSVAMVRCSGGDNAQKRYEYTGICDCDAAVRILGTGPNACSYGCMGFGNCVKACPFDAMHIVNGVAKVDHEKCVGCMSCAAVCPKNLIIKVPYAADITVACASKEKGAVLKNYCNIGCIGCKLCEKNCPNDAIHVIDNLASIDYTKCVSCGICATKCPRHLIVDSHLETENDIPLDSDGTPIHKVEVKAEAKEAPAAETK